MKLTQEQKRIKIMKAYTQIVCEDGSWSWLHPHGTWYRCLRNDPLQDLNVIHELEKELTYKQRRKYIEILFNLPSCECESNTFAKAEQRCEAFGLAASLWDEGD